MRIGTENSRLHSSSCACRNMLRVPGQGEIQSSLDEFYSTSRPRGSFHISATLVQPSARIVISATANVPALTGIALNSVGPMPFQKPTAPSFTQVCLKQSLMFL